MIIANKNYENKLEAKLSLSCAKLSQTKIFGFVLPRTILAGKIFGQNFFGRKCLQLDS